MPSLIDHLISIGIFAIMLWALDKYKNYRIDNWKKSFIVSAIYWLIIGLPSIYLTLKPLISFLVILTFLGILVTTVVVRVISSWIVYPLLDELKKLKKKK